MATNRRTLAIILFLIAVLALLAGFVAAVVLNWRGAPVPDREIQNYEISEEGDVDLPADAPIEFGMPGTVVPDGERPATPSCVLHGPAEELLEFTGGNAAYAHQEYWRFGYFTTTDAGTYRITCGAFQDEITVQTYPWTTADAEESRGRMAALVSLTSGVVVAALSLWAMVRVLRRSPHVAQNA